MIAPSITHTIHNKSYENKYQTKNLSSMGTGSAINYESLANICKKFPETLTEFTYISICLIII